MTQEIIQTILLGIILAITAFNALVSFRHARQHKKNYNIRGMWLYDQFEETRFRISATDPDLSEQERIEQRAKAEVMRGIHR